MTSKIISRAACLREFASNPKSFSNCPDLHGGVSDLPEDRICTKRALGKNSSARRQFAVLVPLKFAYALGPACIVSGFTIEYGKNSRFPISTYHRLACV